MLEEHARHVGGGRDGRSRARARLRRRVREEGFDLRATTVRLPKLATQRFGRERHPARLHRRENRTRGISVSSSADTIPGDSDAALARNATSAASATAAASADPAAAACALFVASPPSFHRAASRVAFFVQITLERARDVLRLVPRAARAARECRRFRSKKPRGDANVHHGRRDDPRQRAFRRAHRAKLRFEIDGHLSRTGVARIARTASHRNPRLRESREAVPAVDDDGDENVASGFDGNATAIPSGGDAAGP